MSIFLAQKFPKSQITALSNSRTQVEFIRQRAKELRLENVTTIVANVLDHQFIASSFDRIIAIEVRTCDKSSCVVLQQLRANYVYSHSSI